MKLLSVVIPCYNSQEYMRKCIDSLLPGEAHVELLIINDGSTDDTASIANEYAEKYPTIVKTIHQENAGHGGAINTGIDNASGLFIKVVDSDDWVDSQAYESVIMTLKKLVEKETIVDLVISNFVYEKSSKKIKKVMRYNNCFPENQVISWDQTKPFRKGQYLMMHSLIYRTDLLKSIYFKLPKHTFYVDNLFVFLPLKHVKKMIYINVDLYRYYIGRDEQSVNEQVMIKNLDHQIKVNKAMINQMNLEYIEFANLQRYMLHHLEIVTVITSIMLRRSGTNQHLEEDVALWQYAENHDPRLYNYLRKGCLGKMLNIPGRFGYSLSMSAYKISQKIIGFN